MKEIESILKTIEGYLISIERDTVNGWYFMKVGILKSWVFNENNEIGLEILSENEAGKLLKIFPKKTSVVIDDLILFVGIIINTNETIANKEREFAAQMEEFKKNLEKKASEFYKELDELKDSSFKKVNDRFITELNKEEPKVRKPRKPRTPKAVVSGDTTTNTQSVEKISDLPK